MKKNYSFISILFLSKFSSLFIFSICWFVPLFIFSSCDSKQPISEAIVEEDQRRVIYGQPVSIKNTDFTVVPMQIVDARDIAEASYTDDGKTAEDISQNAHNLIFFDERTKETHLLTTQKFKRIAFSFRRNRNI